MIRRNKKIMYVALASLVLMISIGYALLSANLKINGTSRIENVTWDVHFENAVATANSTVTPTTAPSAPAASKLQEISYDVIFNEPGQIYEFTVDVKNGGSIDAMIQLFASKIKIGDGEEQDITLSTLPSYLNYSVTYSDGTAIANNHLLAATEKETIKVRVEFKKDITAEQLAEASGKTISLNIGINYVQADENATASHPAPNYVYTINYFNSEMEGNNLIYLGQTFPSEIDKLTEDEAKSNGYVYLKHKLGEDDKVEESYVEFIINDELKTKLKNEYCKDGTPEENKDCEEQYDKLVNNTYSLRGAIEEELYSDSEKTKCKLGFNDDMQECISPYAQSNLNTIREAFGTLTENSSVCIFSNSGFQCELNGINVLGNLGSNAMVDLYSSGACLIQGNMAGCCDPNTGC